MNRIFISAILLVSILYSHFIFSNPERINFWILIMWAPAVVAMSINYIRYNSLKKLFEPITRKVNFNSIAFAILYPLIFLGVLALLLTLTGLVSVSRIKLPELSLVQIAVAPFANFLLMYGEEYGWRGFLLEGLVKKHRKIKAAIIVGSIWAAFHFPVVYGLANQYNIDKPLVYSGIQMIAVFVLSFPFAHAYFLSRNIIGPMILHFLWNLLNPILFGNLYLDRPGVFKGEISLINGEGISGIVLGTFFLIWFMKHYKRRKRIYPTYRDQ